MYLRLQGEKYTLTFINDITSAQYQLKHEKWINSETAQAGRSAL